MKEGKYDLTVKRLREILQEIEAQGCGDCFVVVGARHIGQSAARPMPIGDIEAASMKFRDHPSRGGAILETEFEERLESDPEVIALLTPQMIPQWAWHEQFDRPIPKS